MEAPVAQLEWEHDPKKVRFRRQRKFNHKSRNGCITCKIRRVKCDETHPKCKRCTDTGRECDGYSPSPPAQTEVQFNWKVQTAPAYALSSLPTVERGGKRTFNFFRNVTVPYLCGFFKDYVHNCLMLQLCQSEPAVRYAMLAVGSQHEARIAASPVSNSDSDSGEDSSPDTPNPGVQYGKALLSLRQLINTKRVSLDVVLICSLLLMHFELLRGDSQAGLSHLDNALSVIHGDMSSGRYRIDFRVAGAITRVDLNATGHYGLREAGMALYGPGSEKKLPSKFDDITEARYHLNLWSGRLLYFKRTHSNRHKFQNPGDIPIEVYARARHLERTFQKFMSLLDDLQREKASSISLFDQHSLALLRVWARHHRISAGTSLYSESSAMDLFLEEYRSMLEICETIVDCPTADSGLFSASFSEGVVLPLFFVTVGCRDSKIRRRALKVMEAVPTDHSAWHFEAMCGLAKLIIDYEEEYCGMPNLTTADIPEWRRIHNTEFEGWSATETARSVNVLIRSRPNGMDGEWYDDTRSIVYWTSPSPTLKSQLQKANTMFDFVAEKRWWAMMSNSLNNVRGGGILTQRNVPLPESKWRR